MNTPATTLRAMALAYEAEHHALVTEDFRQAFTAVPQTDTDDRRHLLEGAYRDLNHMAAMAAALPHVTFARADFYSEAMYLDFVARLSGERAPNAPPVLQDSTATS